MPTFKPFSPTLILDRYTFTFSQPTPLWHPLHLYPCSTVTSPFSPGSLGMCLSYIKVVAMAGTESETRGWSLPGHLRFEKGLRDFPDATSRVGSVVFSRFRDKGGDGRPRPRQMVHRFRGIVLTYMENRAPDSFMKWFRRRDARSSFQMT